MAIDIAKIDVEVLFANVDKYKAQLNEAKSLQEKIAKDQTRLKEIASGIPKAVLALMKSNGKSNGQHMKRGEVDKLVLAAIQNSSKPLQNKQICEAAGLDKARVNLSLPRLVKAGTIKKVGIDGKPLDKNNLKDTAYVMAKK